jgi:threonine dehydrogenase-like Zn-dependent dehydrogenase
MGVTLARKMGAKETVIVDIDAGKRDAALKASATKAVDGGAADAVAQIQAATGGGAWAVIDFVGSSATVGLAVSSIIKGGTVVVVGLYGGDITVPTPYLPLRAMTLRGSYVGSQTDMAELLDLVKRTGMPPVPIRTRPLDEVNATLNDLRAGKNRPPKGETDGRHGRSSPRASPSMPPPTPASAPARLNRVSSARPRMSPRDRVFRIRVFRRAFPRARKPPYL